MRLDEVGREPPRPGHQHDGSILAREIGGRERGGRRRPPRRELAAVDDRQQLAGDGGGEEIGAEDGGQAARGIARKHRDLLQSHIASRQPGRHQQQRPVRLARHFDVVMVPRRGRAAGDEHRAQGLDEAGKGKRVAGVVVVEDQHGRARFWQMSCGTFAFPPIRLQRKCRIRRHARPFSSYLPFVNHGLGVPAGPPAKKRPIWHENWPRTGGNALQDRLLSFAFNGI